MEDLQHKFQKGINSVQKGFEGNKEKKKSSQEVINLKIELSRLEDIRSEYLLRLGEIYYCELRDGEVSKDSISILKEKILNSDKEIFNLLKEIDLKEKIDGTKKCKCGTLVRVEDNFCRQCGEKVEFITIDVDNSVTCKKCETVNPKDNKYCNCCGNIIS